jgi:hypothetical protein
MFTGTERTRATCSSTFPGGIEELKGITGYFQMEKANEKIEIFNHNEKH